MRSPEVIDSKGPAAYIAEFVGTFFLVLAICGERALPARSPARGESAEPPLVAR